MSFTRCFSRRSNRFFNPAIVKKKDSSGAVGRGFSIYFVFLIELINDRLNSIINEYEVVLGQAEEKHQQKKEE